MNGSFKKPWRAEKVFGLYFPALFLITAVLSFSLLHQSQRSLLSYALLNARKSNEVVQAAFTQAAAQINTQFALLHYDGAFRTVMEAERYGDVTPEVLDDLRDTVGARANLPGGAAISLSGSHIQYSTIFLTSQLRTLDGQMPQGRRIQALGLFSPQGTLAGKHYLIFGCGYFSHGSKIGNVYITLDPNEFVSSLAVMGQPGLSFILADGAGSAVLLGGGPGEEDPGQLRQILEGEGVSRRYASEKTLIPGLNCTLYSVVDTDVSLAPVNAMYKTTFAALGLLIVISLIGNVYLGRFLVQPLSRFGQYLSRLCGDQAVLSGTEAPLVPAGCAEIQEIEGQFSALLGSIAALNAQVQQKAQALHRAELLRKETEIESLRSQIDPHFLYNTLELIRSDATAGRIHQVSAITAAMGKFYRYSVKGSPMVKLKEELEHIKAYLTIQQERFNGKISVVYDISQEAGEAVIPKMILQPLVENAIVHALEPASGGVLFLGAGVQEGTLTICVRDSGVGIPPEQLQQIRQRLAAPPKDSPSIGLVNVSQRLGLQYGAQSAFSVESTPQDGTCIYLTLPARPPEQAG